MGAGASVEGPVGEEQAKNIAGEKVWQDTRDYAVFLRHPRSSIAMHCFVSLYLFLLVYSLHFIAPLYSVIIHPTPR